MHKTKEEIEELINNIPITVGDNHFTNISEYKRIKSEYE